MDKHLFLKSLSIFLLGVLHPVLSLKRLARQTPPILTSCHEPTRVVWLGQHDLI